MEPPEWQFNAIQGSTVRDGVRLHHLGADAELLVRGGRLIRGRGYASAPAEWRRELARTGAILRLRGRQRYHIHAAGVVDPAGRAWLLAGPTGSGKSTLAYALARRGWSVLGDDGIIVELAPGGPIVHGWREPLRVSRALATVFPELRDDDRVQRVLPDDARGRVEVSMRSSRMAPLDAVVWVQQGPDDHIVPLPPAEALIELIRQSAWVLIADGRTHAHLDALRRVATDVPSFRLTHSAAQLQRIDQTLLGSLTPVTAGAP